MNEQFDFDVFLCHNSKDKPLIIKIADGLTKRGLKVWIDINDIYPGEQFQSAIAKAIPRTKSAAIFFGSHGVGKWQKAEISVLGIEKVDREMILVPILLPGVNKIPSEPEDCLWLKGHNYLKLETEEINEQFLNDLVRGVRRQNIELQNPTSATNLSPRISNPQLAEIIIGNMNIGEVRTIWYFTLEYSMDNEMNGKSLSDCAIQLVENAKNRKLTDKLIENICKQRPNLANNLNPH